MMIVRLSSDGVQLFRAFLQKEFSDENIEFWLAVEEYKKLKGGKILPKAQRIYGDFVAVQSPREVLIILSPLTR